RTRRPARIDDYGDTSGRAADVARDWGFRSAVGAPISVGGRLWGVISVASTHEEPLPTDTEARLAGFTELVGTALANAEVPAALAEGGLRPALKTLARHSAVPVRLDVGIDRPLPEHIELATYYVVAEAVTNAVKHARASVIDIRVAAGAGVLRVSVRDDGLG